MLNKLATTIAQRPSSGLQIALHRGRSWLHRSQFPQFSPSPKETKAAQCHLTWIHLLRRFSMMFCVLLHLFMVSSTKNQMNNICHVYVTTVTISGKYSSTWLPKRSFCAANRGDLATKGKPKELFEPNYIYLFRNLFSYFMLAFWITSCYHFYLSADIAGLLKPWVSSMNSKAKQIL